MNVVRSFRLTASLAGVVLLLGGLAGGSVLSYDSEELQQASYIDESGESSEVIELTLEDAQQRLLDKSRELDRINIELEKMEINKDKTEDQLDIIEGQEEVLEGQINLIEANIDEVNNQLLALDFDPHQDNGNEFTYEDNEDHIISMLLRERQSLELEKEQLESELDQLDKNIAEAEEGIKEVERGMELQSMELTQTRQELKYEAKETYINLLSLESQLETMEEVIENLEKALEEEQARKDVGKSTALAVDMTEREKVEMENTYQTLQENYRYLEEDFLDRLGYSMDASLELKDEVSFDMEEFQEEYDFDEALDNALERGHQMRLMGKMMIFASERLDWAEEEGYSSEEVELRELELEEATLDKQEVEQSIKKLMSAAENAFSEARRDYQLARKDFFINQEILRGEELQKELGMSTSRDVAEAMVNKNQAERELMRQEHEAYLLARSLELLEDGFMVGLPETEGPQEEQQLDTGGSEGESPRSKEEGR